MYSSYYAPRSSAYTLILGENSGWIIASLILAIIGGIVLYFTYLSKKNEKKYTGFLAWMYDFLSFKKMVVENVLRVTYLIIALFVTLSSFAMISTSFLAFVIYLIVGNLVVRLIYELSLVVLIICRNTTEINKKLTPTKVDEIKRDINATADKTDINE